MSVVFTKTGCGSFRYGLRNLGTTSASYQSRVSGVALGGSTVPFGFQIAIRCD